MKCQVFTPEEYRDSNIENEINVKSAEPLVDSYSFMLHTANGEQYFLSFTGGRNRRVVLVKVPKNDY